MQQEPAPEELSKEERAEWYRQQAEEDSKEFVDRVAELAELEHDEARQAIGIVLCVFEQRLSSGEARKMEAELPYVVQQARRECMREGDEHSVPFGQPELFLRVAERMPRGGLATGRAVTAVLAAVRERLSEKEALDVGNQLPHDLQALWDEPMPDKVPLAPLTGLPHQKARTMALSEMAEAKPNRSQITMGEFLDRLADRTALDPGDAEVVAVGVLWPLEWRIPARQADALNEELPRELQILLQDAVVHDAELPDWRLRGFYRRVAQELDMQPRDVVPLVDAVFRTVREVITPETVRHVGSELPDALKDVWFGIPWGEE